MMDSLILLFIYLFSNLCACGTVLCPLKVWQLTNAQLHAYWIEKKQILPSPEPVAVNTGVMP